MNVYVKNVSEALYLNLYCYNFTPQLTMGFLTTIPKKATAKFTRTPRLSAVTTPVKKNHHTLKILSQTQVDKARSSAYSLILP
jgi:hypothetical protein